MGFYIVVIVDIDTKDLKTTSSFPPVAFLTVCVVEGGECVEEVFGAVEELGR